MPKGKYSLIVILGPTASGKTKLAVKIARRFNGEIISADSRQVYKYMNIGTGKDLKEYGKIKHYLINISDPKTEFNLAKFQKIASRIIKDINSRNKLPILVGGTGLYISSIVENYQLNNTKPDKTLRKTLEGSSLAGLLKQLKKLNIKIYNKIDKQNKRRIIRALEISINKNKKLITDYKLPTTDYQIFGIKIERHKLIEKIDKRINQMIRLGLVNEVAKLHQQHKVSWNKLESFGMEYKYPALFLQGKISKDEMVEKIKISNRQYAKRQMTWFRGMEKRGIKINWINPTNLSGIFDHL